MKEQFTLLITSNQGLILKVCNMYCNSREDREDLFQDIVLQLWRAYGSFNGASKVSTWIYRVALNIAITRLRKETKREKFTGLDDNVFEIAATDNKEENEQVLQMYEAIKKLSEVERAITMLYMDDYSYREIAEVMGLSESNIGFNLSKIRSKLKTMVNNG
ncbi:RNA polymerase sigma factor [Mucilaginibacter jinjuensis]|uniref:Sigma-70 family RNA polymerase sigma factor n=1 Tax=Mucilaginibacter jinjuensis TaxID=1176721 RepID=A0ABY7T7K7_9SPHI|nr:sigma-70 family RNA polymerase sigma factor [Mucilaginibacter jinjuensis]WCT12464.1 sigma-70 family RNA polymerase sigma factor [Mucilaginibacter jinjuensis]